MSGVACGTGVACGRRPKLDCQPKTKVVTRDTDVTVSQRVLQMSYDLARLRLNGLIERRPASNTYDLTPDGQRVAIFYTKVHNRLLRPLIGADSPPAPLELRQALRTIDRHVHAYTDAARLGTAA